MKDLSDKCLPRAMEGLNIMVDGNKRYSSATKFINHKHLELFIYPAFNCRGTFLAIYSGRL